MTHLETPSVSLYLRLRTFLSATMTMMPLLKKYSELCTQFVLVLSLSTPLFLTSCSNYVKHNLKKTTNSLNNEADSGSFFPINLTKILPSAASGGTSTLLDFIGNGSGEIGSFCSDITQCKIAYTIAGQTQQVVDLVYGDSNVLRANLPGSLNSTTTTLTAQIQVVAANIFSNPLNVNITGGSFGGFLDLTEPNSFLNIKRVQCRDIISIPYMYDPGAGGGTGSEIPGIYDPFQSEHIRFSYPLNYYSGGLGTNMLALYLASAETPNNFSKFECSFNPHVPAYWENMEIYSQVADSSGSFNIYPPTGSFNRSTFYLAKQATGAFNIPVNVFLSPGKNTEIIPNGQSTTNKFAPVGFGARVNGSLETGTCPDLPRPPNWEVVKVFQFRASLATRRYVAASFQMQNVPAIGCDPGTFQDGGPPSLPVFQDCSADLSSNTTLHALGNALNPNGLASRVLLKNGPFSQVPCVRFSQDPSLAALGVSAMAGQANRAPGGGSIPPGADSWERIGSQIPGSIVDDTWNLGQFTGTQPLINNPLLGTTASFQGFQGTPPLPPPGDTGVPRASILDNGNGIFTQDLDASSREDTILIVTPANISKDQIEAAAASNPPSGAGAPYIPLAFTHTELCTTFDPQSAVCQNEIQKFGKIYGPLFNDITDTNSNPADVFPICAVRPIAN